MDQLNHHDYYVERAASAHALAAQAANPAIAAIHAEMAGRYDIIVAEIEREMTQEARQAA